MGSIVENCLVNLLVFSLSKKHPKYAYFEKTHFPCVEVDFLLTKKKK
jgi:hypothetical protein